MKLQDCKYRLPCAWCDKYDRPCKAVEHEIQKMIEECEHEWRYRDTNSGGHQYVCIKCNTIKTVPIGNLYGFNNSTT